jgi:hypothetical protein
MFRNSKASLFLFFVFLRKELNKEGFLILLSFIPKERMRDFEQCHPTCLHISIRAAIVQELSSCCSTFVIKMVLYGFSAEPYPQESITLLMSV